MRPSDFTLEEIMEEHSEWAMQTFGERSYTIDLEKMKHEADEAIISGEWEEFYDMLLCFLSACKLRGIPIPSLLNGTHYKIQVNKKRQWKQNDDGTFSHVKEIA